MNNLNALVFVGVAVLLVLGGIEAKKMKKEGKNILKEEIDDKANATPLDPCTDLQCISGQECIIDYETGEGKCVCIRECPENLDERRKVCSNYNTTWTSDCHLLKHRCDCVDSSRATPGCNDESKHMHINYYGECKEIEKCESDVLEDFPRRMREWLDHILERRLKDAEAAAAAGGDASNAANHQAHKWIDAIIWKFCDLDREPHDRHVSRHELFPLRAPLLSMESCITDFLDSCDPNDDHKITLSEWGKCLGASAEEMQDKCTQFVAIAPTKTTVILD